VAYRLIEGSLESLTHPLTQVVLTGDVNMATDRPPPYFPQGTLSPPDQGRYRKFKLALIAGGLLVLVSLTGAVVGLVYLAKWIF
jgi:hypothetical protein